ncbi:MAG TPA: hypothetical protein VMI31_13835 [Fimbriimonadaceae bacterium]|nr:hypothetical protein [Fimbriimonadaceae bacterium]
MIKALVVAGVAGLCLLLCGCQPPKPKFEPMGDKAPTLGSSGKTSFNDFLVGRWCVDDPFAGGIDKHHFYEFKSDGTFTCGQGTMWKCTGKWASNTNSATLSYLTMNDESYEAYRAEVKKGDESGVQALIQKALIYDGVYGFLDKSNVVYVDQDQKHLTFSPPTQAPPPGSPDTSGAGDLAGILAKGSTKLERMDQQTQ